MNFHTLILSIQETIFRNRINAAIDHFRTCSNNYKSSIDILFQRYNTESYVKHVKIDEQLKKINELITYLNSRISILKYKKYQNWIMPSPYVNKPKFLHDEIQKLCICINTKINHCEQMIHGYKETPYVKTKRRAQSI